MKAIIDARKINYVLHFTQLSNLDNILKNGLIGRSDLVLSDSDFEYNDEYRFDNQQNAICCSIGHPNYKMFYRLRCNNADIEWVVLGIEPSILWEKECLFCHTNAASSEVTGIPIESRKGLTAFNKLFEEIDGKPTREELDLPDTCPTDPQAEILVPNHIEPEFIFGAITQSKSTEILLKEKYSETEYEFMYHRSFFSPRKDYTHW